MPKCQPGSRLIACFECMLSMNDKMIEEIVYTYFKLWFCYLVGKGNIYYEEII